MDDWPAGAWRSEAAATDRNRGTCILQETPVKLRGFLIRERRYKARFYMSSARGLGHQRQCRAATKTLSRSVRINNAMIPSHSLRRCLLSFFAKRVLVASISPSPNLLPWLRQEKIRECIPRKYRCFVWFPKAIFGGNYPYQNPHPQKGNGSPKGVTRFGNETPPSCLQDTIHLRDDASLFGQNS